MKQSSARCYKKCFNFGSHWRPSFVYCLDHHDHVNETNLVQWNSSTSLSIYWLKEHSFSVLYWIYLVIPTVQCCCSFGKVWARFNLTFASSVSAFCKNFHSENLLRIWSKFCKPMLQYRTWIIQKFSMFRTIKFWFLLFFEATCFPSWNSHMVQTHWIMKYIMHTVEVTEYEIIKGEHWWIPVTDIS